MLVKQNSEHKTFNLDNDVIDLIKEGSQINNMSQSGFIEFLVNSWDEKLNPMKNLKHIRNKKKLLNEEILEMDKEEGKIIDNLQKIEEWRKLKQERKPDVISNLVRIISENKPDSRETVENIAKIQSIRLGIPATQLIFEAMDTLKNNK